MSNQRISDSLAALFSTHSLVFWHDVGGEFAGVVDALHLDGVQLVRLDACAALQVNERLKRWVQPHDGALDIDRKMMAVLMRAENAEAATIFLRAFSALALEGGGDLDAVPKTFAEIAANGLEDAFWHLAEHEFGYAEKPPSLRGLLFAIFANDSCQSIGGIGGAPPQLQQFLTKDRAKAASMAVFASRWRADTGNYTSYDRLSLQVAEGLRMREGLHRANGVVRARCRRVGTFFVPTARSTMPMKKRIVVCLVHGGHKERAHPTRPLPRLIEVLPFDLG